MIKIIKYGTDEYYQTVQIRSDILRKPLGLEFTEADFHDEENQIHAVAMDNGEIVGCLILAPQKDGSIRMRQVAVLENMQNKGVGEKLVAFFETYAKENKFNKIILNARKTAVPFYEALGYKVVSDYFIQHTTEHCKMEKQL